MIHALGGISTAFGLAGSAGLNAYIPLLLVALAARFPLKDPLLNLTEPYDVLGSWWAIGILVVLLLIEMTVDKIPAVDTLNDGIQTFIRPTAGAILFAANANIINDIHPVIALTAGLLVAGGVHAAKGVARPVVTAATAGTGNWLVSLIEDIAAFFMSLVSILLPLLAGIAFLVFIFYFVRWFRHRKKKKEMVFQ
ncbi:MAG: DUF4126 domain-containing protein [Anaerolineae bacterium]